MTSRLRTAALATVALACGFAVLELALRATQRVTQNTPMFTLLPGYRPATFQLSPFLVFGPRLDWSPPGREPTPWLYFNNQGFRSPDTIGPPAAGEFRIVTLGGSTTEDIWNRAGIHWPLVMECELHRLGHTDVRVLNAAMSAYSSAHSLVRLATDIIEYQPHLVVVLHNINDLGVSYYAMMNGTPLDHHYLGRYGQKSYTGVVTSDDIVLSRVWSALRNRLGGRQLPPPDEFTQDDSLVDGRRIFDRNLRSLRLVAGGWGAEVAYLTMPASPSSTHFDAMRRSFRVRRAGLGPLPEEARFRRDFAAFNDVVRAQATRGATTIDMAALMPQDSALYADLVHYSTAGVLAFGRIAAAQLAAILPEGRGESTRSDAPCAWTRDPAVRAAVAAEGIAPTTLDASSPDIVALPQH